MDEAEKTEAIKLLVDESVIAVSDEQAEQFEIMQRKEELHADLRPWVEEDGPLGPFLKHPLVYVMLGNPDENGTYPFAAHANEIFRRKHAAVEEARRDKKWSALVHVLHERPYRLWAFHQIEQELEDREWWSLLGSIWTDSENIWENRDEWLEYLGSERSCHEAMMEDAEREFLAKLPEQIIIYRGYEFQSALESPSWTLDRDRAVWFAKRLHIPDRGGKPHLATAVVMHENVLAYFNGRQEEEIVVLPENLDIIKTEEVAP